MYQEISPQQFKQKYLENPTQFELIDIRQPEEFDQIKIKGSKLIPMSQLENQLDSINRNKKVIFICRTGSRSGYVTQILNQNGYNGTNLAGGIQILHMNCQECMEKGNLDSKYFE